MWKAESATVKVLWLAVTAAYGLTPSASSPVGATSPLAAALRVQRPGRALAQSDMSLYYDGPDVYCVSPLEFSEHPGKCWDLSHGHHEHQGISGMKLGAADCSIQPNKFFVPIPGHAGHIKPAMYPDLCLQMPQPMELQFWRCTDAPKNSTTFVVEAANEHGHHSIRLALEQAGSICPHKPQGNVVNDASLMVWTCDKGHKARAQILHTHSIDECLRLNSITPSSEGSPGSDHSSEDGESAVAVAVTVNNLDYKKLQADKTLFDQFPKALGAGLAFEAGHGVHSEQIEVLVSKGSGHTINSALTVNTDSASFARDLATQLNSRPTLSATLTNHILELDGINGARTGTVSVSVEYIRLIIREGQPEHHTGEPSEPALDAASFGVTLQGLDFESLMADPELSEAVSDIVKSEVAAAAGHGTRVDDINEFRMSAGSLRVDGQVEPPSGVAAEELQEGLSSPTLADNIAKRVSQIPGIEKVSTGPISAVPSGGPDSVHVETVGFLPWIWWLCALPSLVACNALVTFFFRSPKVTSSRDLGLITYEWPGANRSADDFRYLDAIVVPGGGLNKEGMPPPWVVERLKRAKGLRDVALSQEDARRPFIITLSAGAPRRNIQIDHDSGTQIKEAEANARFLVRELGVPPDCVLKEELSLDTVGNAYFLRTMHTDVARLRRLCVVTNEYHMARTRAIFTKVFALPPLPPGMEDGYVLRFEEVPDTGVKPDALFKRKDAEVGALDGFHRASEQWRSLSDLHNFLFKNHSAYVANNHRSDANNDMGPGASIPGTARSNATLGTARSNMTNMTPSTGRTYGGRAFDSLSYGGHGV